MVHNESGPLLFPIYCSLSFSQPTVLSLRDTTVSPFTQCHSASLAVKFCTYLLNVTFNSPISSCKRAFPSLSFSDAFLYRQL